jgi:hypothetical protein
MMNAKAGECVSHTPNLSARLKDCKSLASRSTQHIAHYLCFSGNHKSTYKRVQKLHGMAILTLDIIQASQLLKQVIDA